MVLKANITGRLPFPDAPCMIYFIYLPTCGGFSYGKGKCKYTKPNPMGIIWLKLTLPETKISCTCFFYFATFTILDSAPIGRNIFETFCQTKKRHGGLLQTYTVTKVKWKSLEASFDGRKDEYLWKWNPQKNITSFTYPWNETSRVIPEVWCPL